jgi:Abortive infection C-terminus
LIRLRPKTLTKLAADTCGNSTHCPYRTGPVLVQLFNGFGSADQYGQGFPSRHTYAEQKIDALNGRPELTRLVEQIYDPLEFEGHDGCDHSAAVVDINKFLHRDGLELLSTPSGMQLKPIRPISVAFSATVADPLSQHFIAEHVIKCEEKLKAADYAGAITNARSLCEEVLCHLERRLDPKATQYDGDLRKLFKRTRKLLNMDPDKFKEREDVTQLLRGLTSIVDALASISNDLGDRHGGSLAKPQPHHALLAVNAANTLCTFLNASYALRNAGQVLEAADLSE